MARRPTDNILRWFLAAIVLLFVASALVSIGAVAVQGSRNADAAATEILDRIGTRTVDLVDGHLQPAAVSLVQMAEAVRNPTVGTPDSFERLLAVRVSTMPEVSGAYIAYPDGTFHFVRREGDDLHVKRIAVADGTRTVVEGALDAQLRPVDLAPIPDDGFEPTERPWYQEATADPGTTVWTAPYVFFSSKEPGVTTARAVVGDDGEVLAVVGIDVALSALNQFLDDLPIDATAQGFIVADGRVIAAPENPVVVTTDDGDAVTLTTTEDLDLDLDSDRVTVTDLRAPGLPDWQVVVRVERIEFVEAVEDQSRTTMIAVVLAVLIGLALLVTVASRVRRPFDELLSLADRDPLTDLPNRRAVLGFGRSALRRAVERDHDVSVAMVDIDFFKAVNDRHGHAVGDEALRRLGATLRNSVRPDDMVGRYGGDEFVVILANTDRDAAEHTMARLIATAERELRSVAATAGCALTAGLATRSGRPVDIATLIAEADSELLAAKRARDDAVVTGSPIRE